MLEAAPCRRLAPLNPFCWVIGAINVKFGLRKFPLGAEAVNKGARFVYSPAGA